MAFSDASSTGYGGYVVELGSEVAHGQWSELQMVQSSTWRELKAVDLVLRSFASKLAGHVVSGFQITRTSSALCKQVVGNRIFKMGQ